MAPGENRATHEFAVICLHWDIPARCHGGTHRGVATASSPSSRTGKASPSVHFPFSRLAANFRAGEFSLRGVPVREVGVVLREPLAACVDDEMEHPLVGGALLEVDLDAVIVPADVLVALGVVADARERPHRFVARAGSQERRGARQVEIEAGEGEAGRVEGLVGEDQATKILVGEGVGGQVDEYLLVEAV